MLFQLNLDQGDLTLERESWLIRRNSTGCIGSVTEVQCQGENPGFHLEEAPRGRPGISFQDERHLLDIEAEAQIGRGVPVACRQRQVGPIRNDARSACDFDCCRQDVARRVTVEEGFRGQASTSCKAPGRAVNNGCR